MVSVEEWSMAATGGKGEREGKAKQTLIEPAGPRPGSWGMHNRSLPSKEGACSSRDRSLSLPCQCHHMRPALSACATTRIHRLDISSSARCIRAHRHAPWTGGGFSKARGRPRCTPTERPPHLSDPAFWGAGASGRLRGRVRSWPNVSLRRGRQHVSQDWGSTRVCGTGPLVGAVKTTQRRYTALYDHASHDYVGGALARAESGAT